MTIWVFTAALLAGLIALTRQWSRWTQGQCLPRFDPQ